MSNRKGSKALPGGTEKANKGTVYEASSAYLFVASLPYQSFLKPLNLLKKRSLQSCNSAVIKAFNTLHMGILN